MRILTGLREPVFYFTKVSVAKRKISAGFLSGLEHIELFNHRNRKGKCKMSIPNLPTDFKDDILNTGVNQKRKYQIIYNNDGTVSFEDVTAYSQTGSDFGSSEVNATNGAINNIYDERILNLEDLDLVTEPGFFVDALAVAELNGKIEARTPQIISGTKVIHDINNVTAVVLFTLSELQSAFKAFDAVKECFACSITNGDENASSNHFDGTTWKGTDLMALFNGRETGSARFNYIVAYNPYLDDAI